MVVSYLPGYCYYQQFFEMCDDFNFGLHDRCWPHKRGGHGIQGDVGRHNDFIHAAILQNSVNAYFAINEIDPGSISFEELMVTLSLDLYRESKSLDPVGNFIYL